MSWDLTPIDWDSPFGMSGSEEIERAWNRRLVKPEQFGFDPDRAGGAMRNIVYARRYGGDLQGVLDQLDALKAMGVDGLYLCPVFVSRSLHKYDASDHRHIDPSLGNPGVFDDPGPGHVKLGPDEDPQDETSWSWSEADRWFIDVFIKQAHQKGFRVMLDGVWNHVGLDHFAFSDVQKHGSASVYKDWFDVVFDTDGELIGWQGWSRVNGNLPEFRHIGDDLAPGPKQHIMAVTRRWMDPNGDGDPSDGIDGWRLDVAGEIGEAFWKDWRAQVKSINPQALIIAEIWSDAGSMLGDHAFDGQMNYPAAYPISDWLSIGDTRGDARVAASRLRNVFHHGQEIDLVQLNLMTSHDTERLASLMHNDRVRGYDQDASRWDPSYDHDSIDQDDRVRALCAIATLVACPGSVMIYNGDEFALPGADDPDNRRPIPWGLFSEEQQSFRDQCARLLQLRSDPEIGAVLRRGSAAFSATDAGSLLIRRVLADQMVELIINPEGVTDKCVADLGTDPEWINERERKYVRTANDYAVFVRILARSN